ncbi:MAG: hypothetical protein HY584_04245 [Candidatus Omnitrophica bacterium]|nr:hypothetical protein [Candidatus Omnitrophota bacterium]
MLDIITRLVQPIVKIKREEWRKTILMFLYFSFSLATLYIIKPVRSSLFLTTHGAESLRYAYIGEWLFLIFVTFAYVKAFRWFKNKNVLFSISTGFFTSNILIFWVLFKAGHLEWLAYLFYFWVAVYSITIVTQGWTLANDIFNPQEAKRLFGFTISGGSLGGIIGGLVTNRFAERIGTENLLLIAAVFLGSCIFVVNAIWRYEKTLPAGARRREQDTFASTAGEKRKSTWSLLIESRYLLLIVALVMIAKASSTILDNQWNSVVENTILEKNARTAFFGGFSALLNGVSFFLQLVVTSYALRHLGIGISLLLLPVGLCFGAGATVFWPVITISSVVRIYDLGMNYSVNQLGKEILYLPISSHVRYRVKPLIDMLAFRGSKGFAGLLITFASPLLGIPDDKLGVLVLILAPLWILAAWAVRDEYMQSIRKLLLNPKEGRKALHLTSRQAANVLGSLEGEHSFEKLKELIVHKSSVTRKMSAAACLAFYSSARDIQRVRKLVEEMIRYEALELKDVDVNRLLVEDAVPKNGFFDRRLMSLLKIRQGHSVDLKAVLRREEKEILLLISQCLNDSNEEIGTKRKAILILTTLGTQGAVDILLNNLGSTKNLSLRFNLIRALNRIRARGELREFNPWIVKKEVMSEIESYKSVLTALDEYKSRRSVSNPQEDYLLATLQAIQEENLERIFRLLGLLYDGDVIRVIYDRLVEMEPDKHVKANALELLENALEPELARVLCPILDEGEWAEMRKKSLDDVVREFLELQDRWLTVCGVFLIVELHLKDFYSMLNYMVQSRVPIVREAAEVALMKTTQDH